MKNNFKKILLLLLTISFLSANAEDYIKSITWGAFKDITNDIKAQFANGQDAFDKYLNNFSRDQNNDVTPGRGKSLTITYQSGANRIIDQVTLESYPNYGSSSSDPYSIINSQLPGSDTANIKSVIWGPHKDITNDVKTQFAKGQDAFDRYLNTFSRDPNNDVAPGIGKFLEIRYQSGEKQFIDQVTLESYPNYRSSSSDPYSIINNKVQPIQQTSPQVIQAAPVAAPPPATSAAPIAAQTLVPPASVPAAAAAGTPVAKSCYIGNTKFADIPLASCNIRNVAKVTLDKTGKICNVVLKSPKASKSVKLSKQQCTITKVPFSQK